MQTLLLFYHFTYNPEFSYQLGHATKRPLPWAANLVTCHYDDVIKWKPFPYYCPFVRGIHQSLVDSLHKGQWHGALMFSLISTWTNAWANNRDAGDLRCNSAHYDITVMMKSRLCNSFGVRANLDFIYGCLISSVLQGLNLKIGHQDCSSNKGKLW